MILFRVPYKRCMYDYGQIDKSSINVPLYLLFAASYIIGIIVVFYIKVFLFIYSKRIIVSTQSKLEDSGIIFFFIDCFDEYKIYEY